MLYNTTFMWPDVSSTTLDEPTETKASVTVTSLHAERFHAMKDQRNDRRPIDKLREGAGSIEIRTPGDESEVSEMISSNDRLLVVKGKGVYEIKLADQIDPERSNAAAPNTVQRILPYGAEEEWVGKTILTAYHLLKGSSAQETVDGDEAFALVLELAQDVSGAHQLRDAYMKAEKEAVESLDPKIRPDRSVVVPSIGNVEARCNEFLQRSDHALRELFRLVRLFYSDVGSGGWESLKTKIDGEGDDIDNFPQFLAEVLPFLQMIRNARNSVEHPRPEQRLVVVDFAVDPKNRLQPPMLEVRHPKTPLDSIPVGVFFSQAIDNLVHVVELMIVFLCARHVKSFGGIPIQVMELPPKRRKSQHVRYGYGALLGGDLVPFG